MKTFSVSAIILAMVLAFGLGILADRFFLKSKEGEKPTSLSEILGSDEKPLMANLDTPDPAQMLGNSQGDFVSASNFENSKANCNVKTQRNSHIRSWNDKVSIIASASAGSCAEALVRLAITDETGKPIFTLTIPARDFSTDASLDSSILTTELDKIIPQAAIKASAYPEWKSSDAKPFGTEFDQATYEKIRANDAPIICFKPPKAQAICLAADPKTGDVKTFLRGN